MSSRRATPEKPRPEEVTERLLAEYKTASLATISSTGVPLASYVPLALDGRRRLLFFVSELSEHTANLSSSTRASLMLIDDESRTEQLFARNRLTFNGTVTRIGRDHLDWPAVSAAYGDRFGKFFSMLSGLNDFHMFALTPDEIRLVVGFGAAYRVSGAGWDEFELLTGR